jgi:chromosome partitioning protein
LAVERVVRGRRRVLLIDADEQGTASDFAALRQDRLGATGFAIAQVIHGTALRHRLFSDEDKFDDILVDVGGRDTAALRAAFTRAELAVVPFQPRSFDVWTLDRVAALIRQAKTVNRHLKAFAVLNCADPLGQDNKAAADALAENPDIAYLDAPLGRRKSFPNCNAIGLSVLEAARPDRKACSELERLADALAAVAARRPGGQGDRTP